MSNFGYNFCYICCWYDAYTIFDDTEYLDQFPELNIQEPNREKKL